MVFFCFCFWSFRSTCSRIVRVAHKSHCHCFMPRNAQIESCLCDTPVQTSLSSRPSVILFGARRQSITRPWWINQKKVRRPKRNFVCNFNFFARASTRNYYDLARGLFFGSLAAWTMAISISFAADLGPTSYNFSFRLVQRLPIYCCCCWLWSCARFELALTGLSAFVFVIFVDKIIFDLCFCFRILNFVMRYWQ